MTNLLANELYKEVIVPTEIQNNMPVDDRKVEYFTFKDYIAFSKLQNYIICLESSKNILPRKSSCGRYISERTF